VGLGAAGLGSVRAQAVARQQGVAFGREKRVAVRCDLTNHDGVPTIRYSRPRAMDFYKALGGLFAGASGSVASVFVRGNAS
jgi:hypothetical protein